MAIELPPGNGLFQFGSTLPVGWKTPGLFFYLISTPRDVNVDGLHILDVEYNWRRITTGAAGAAGSGGTPPVTVADNGKLLTVVNGVPAWATVPAGEVTYQSGFPSADTTHKVWVDTSQPDWPLYYRTNVTDPWPSTPSERTTPVTLTQAQATTGTDTSAGLITGQRLQQAVRAFGFARFIGSATTYAALPTSNPVISSPAIGDVAVLIADEVGTGTYLNPQRKAGIYYWDGAQYALSGDLFLTRPQQGVRQIIPIFDVWPTDAQLRADVDNLGFQIFSFVGIDAGRAPGIYGNSNAGVPLATPISPPIKLLSWTSSAVAEYDSVQVISNAGVTAVAVAPALVLVDSAAGPITVTLPVAANWAGRLIKVFRVGASSNAITIQVAGGTLINGAPSVTLGVTQHDFFECESTGTAVYITAESDSDIHTEQTMQVVTANTAIAASPGNIRYVAVDATAADITITLPNAGISANMVVKIKKIDASANLVTVQRSGTNLIDGSPTYGNIIAQYDSAEFAAYGANNWGIF